MTRLIFALDVESDKKALALAKILQPEVSWLKIGLQLFLSAGPPLVVALRKMNFNIFLDLKFYDIPNTVAAAVKAACSLDVQMLTLHCLGGQRMCEAAVHAATTCPHSPLLLGVTVLTSFAPGEIPGFADSPAELAMLLAKDAASWGLGGIVCSPQEVATLKESVPGLLTVCPGIRLAPAMEDDQRRTMDPGDAARAGADFIVVGRPISQSRDPCAMARQINADLVRTSAYS